MVAGGADAVVVEGPGAIAFLTDLDVRSFSDRSVLATVTADGAAEVVVSAADRWRVDGLPVQDTVTVWAVGADASDARRDARAAAVARATAGHARVAFPVGSAHAHGADDVADSEQLVAEAATVLDADAIRRVRAAVDLADIGYTAIVDRMHPELRVLEIVRNVDRSLRAAGGGGWWSPTENPATTSMLPYSSHDAIAVLLDRRVDDGVLDRTALLPFVLHPLSELHTGAAGTTITFCPPDAATRSASERLGDAIRAAVDAVRPGAVGSEVHAAFSRVIGADVADVDRDQVVGHTLGTGPIGPVLAAGSDHVVQPGSAFTIRGHLHPADPTRQGIAFQTSVLVGDDGPEVLDRVPMRLIELY
ncbi:M24 family metallopeptidase [Curtobacterium flaccumfaciens]|nr:M24 family metallopeptidase [Curtobacterium flaccumfaciens]